MTEPFALRSELGGDRLVSSPAPFPQWTSLVVRIETDGAPAGRGEAGLYAPTDLVAADIWCRFGPFPLGQNPLQPERTGSQCATAAETIDRLDQWRRIATRSEKRTADCRANVAKAPAVRRIERRL
jgi:L-alanine-DL-glutamate epimerase-like enolase superfamily enzyme